jgi:hypothetical protein
MRRRREKKKKQNARLLVVDAIDAARERSEMQREQRPLRWLGSVACAASRKRKKKEKERRADDSAAERAARIGPASGPI